MRRDDSPARSRRPEQPARGNPVLILIGLMLVGGVGTALAARRRPRHRVGYERAAGILLLSALAMLGVGLGGYVRF